MAVLSDLPLNLRFTMRLLFASDNYCFATNTPDRSPTFYFAKGGLGLLNTATLCGRIRTQHGRGPLIDITQSAKKHFFSKSRSRRGRIADRFGGQLSMQEISEVCARYRTVPRDGDHHFEITMKPAHGRLYSRRHSSGGTIVREPRIRSNEKAIALAEKVLAGQCNVKLNGQVVFQSYGPAAGVDRGLGVAAYLERL